MIKIAFFDIDGTLLSHRTNSVPASARASVEALRRKGIKVFIATGRHGSVLNTLTPLEGLVFDGAITLNGQICRDQSGLIHSCPLDPEDVRALIAHAEKRGLSCSLGEADRLYVNFYSDILYEVHTAIHTPLPPIEALNIDDGRKIYQVVLYGDKEELAALPELPGTRVTHWHRGGVDLINVNGGKSVGIAKVLERYGYTPDEAIAFGDGDNDIDMFHAVGTAVAMGNAADRVKAESDYVTTDIDDDGIYNALVHFGIL